MCKCTDGYQLNRDNQTCDGNCPSRFVIYWACNCSSDITKDLHIFMRLLRGHMCHGVSSYVCASGGGVIFKILDTGSLVLISKPDLGFETVSRCVTRLALMHHL